MKHPILLDCDPGNDDTLGILVACGSPNLALMAVTTGAGHLSHARMARNAAIALATAADHPIGAGLARQWPNLLGYNRLTAKSKTTIVTTVGGDGLIVAGAYGKARGMAFALGCGPHWVPPAFVEWNDYPRLWRQTAGWAAGRT